MLKDPALAVLPLLVECGEPGRNQRGPASPNGSTRGTRQPYVLSTGSSLAKKQCRITAEVVSNSCRAKGQGQSD